ncbi:hypothetical protein KSC_073460 [Ktedonobacter sp. SOSP1-52]|nr:hypothetical protein KSC_073460 [Ktedonobacter sp. SOSP1-52]
MTSEKQRERQLQENRSLSPTEQRSMREREQSQLELPFSSFVQTKEYRRFVQVCEASRRYRYIVVCVGRGGWEDTCSA